MKSLAANAPRMRALNRAAILNLIRLRGQSTRPELARQTGLTPTTISDLTRRMLQEGLLQDLGTGESIGGRRPAILGLNPRAGYVIGFDLEMELTVTVLDFSLQRLGILREPLGSDRMPGEICRRLASLVRRAASTWDLQPEKMLGAGLSVPGLVDVDQGVTVYLPHFPWRNYPVARELSACLGAPVWLENEARATALAEQWLGAGRESDDFVCFNVKTGIGAGIVAHQQLYQGAGGSAGEIGHTTIIVDGPPCSCGNYGCLEAVAATSGLLRRCAARLGGELSLGELVQRARAGDRDCLEMLCENGRYIGIGLANLINLLNPGLILLERDLLSYADLIAGAMADVIGKKALSRPAAQVTIRPSTLGEEAPALGAAILPLRQIFAAGGIGGP